MVGGGGTGSARGARGGAAGAIGGVGGADTNAVAVGAVSGARARCSIFLARVGVARASRACGRVGES